MDYPHQRALLRASGLVHARWYEQGYPDVAASGLHPVDHYLRIGAALGRNPSSRFDTRFYLAMNPAVAASSLNPLVHYLVQGRDQGLPCLPEGAGGPVDGSGMDQPADRARVRVARRALLELGLSDGPLAELRDIAAGSEDASARAMAARELGLWALRTETPAACCAALDWLARARADAPDLHFRSRLALAELIAHNLRGASAAGRAAYERAARAGEADPDVMLVRATLESRPEARLVWINAVLEGFGLPPLALMPAGEGDSPYDRLTSARPPPPVADGPLVSVLVAAWQAETTLPTALRALSEQSWRNLDILLIDDASPDPGTARVAQDWAARDPRIRLIRMGSNGGAYVARNRGLGLARGEFVTVHDADDWAHPLRIETQVRHLLANPGLLGCTSRQARADNWLRFTRLAGIGTNVSSFLFRRTPVIAQFGGWDEVRVSADNELIQRIRHVCGRNAVNEMQGGPLAFQRESPGSAINDPVMGIPGFRFGARRAYTEAHDHHRNRGGALCYRPGVRSFPVPAPLRPDRPPRDQARALPVVMATDWRVQDGGLETCLDEIVWHSGEHNNTAGAGTEVGGLGLIELYRHRPGAQVQQSAMAAPLRDLIDGVRVQQLVYGEQVACRLLILRDPACLIHHQRYLPRLEAGVVRVILDRPPARNDWSGLLIPAAKTLGAWLGPDALDRTLWQPADPLIRRAVIAQAGATPAGIGLAGEDWPDLLAAPVPVRLARTARRPGDRLRIGRHIPDPQHGSEGSSRIDPVADLRGLETEADIRLLASSTLPGLWSALSPPGWTIWEFGAYPLENFLSGLDIWLALSESGPFQPRTRRILQAMAAGVPVILSPEWQPLFGPAASYATSATALARARVLLADPAARDRQVAAATAHLIRHHGPAAHGARLQAIGLGMHRPASGL